jgi:hypothetical protein
MYDEPPLKNVPGMHIEQLTAPEENESARSCIHEFKFVTSHVSQLITNYFLR